MVSVLIMLLFFFSEGNQGDLSFLQHQEVNDLINLIKQRLNIQSLECNYNSMYIINPKFTEGKTIGKDISLSFNFKYQQGNFSLSYTSIGRRSRITPEKIKVNNMLELLSRRFSKDHIYKETSNDESDKRKTNFYFYNGTGKRRVLLYESVNSKIKEIPAILGNGPESHCDFCSWGDPRLFIGYIGFDMYDSSVDWFFEDVYNPTACPPKKITELLDIPGETHARREGNYKVLFHCIKCSPFNTKSPKEPERKLGEEYKKWYSFEVWIDENDNIVKIVEIDYFPIIYGEGFVHKLCDHDSGRFFPYEIRKIITFDNFIEFPSGVRVPLKAKMITYRCTGLLYETLQRESLPEIKEWVTKFKEEKINASEFRVLTHCLGPRDDIYFLNHQLEINPETLKVNQPISETAFIAPEPIINHLKEEEENEKGRIEKNELDKKTKKETSSIKPVLFSVFFIVITLIAIFITRRYFNWGT